MISSSKTNEGKDGKGKLKKTFCRNVGVKSIYPLTQPKCFLTHQIHDNKCSSQPLYHPTSFWLSFLNNQRNKHSYNADLRSTMKTKPLNNECTKKRKVQIAIEQEILSVSSAESLVESAAVHRSFPYITSYLYCTCSGVNPFSGESTSLSVPGVQNMSIRLSFMGDKSDSLLLLELVCLMWTFV